MRSVNPDDLEQLAALLDGADPTSLKYATDSVFRRAATLNVTSKLATLHPMAAWATETAPDLRRRAARTRLDNGDLTGGLRWAGFTPDELKNTRLLDPETYLDRLRATALTSIPGLQRFEPAVEYLIGAYGDWKSVTDSTGHVIVQGTALTKVLLGNAFKSTYGEAWKNWAARGIQRVPLRNLCIPAPSAPRGAPRWSPGEGWAGRLGTHQPRRVRGRLRRPPLRPRPRH